MKKKFIIIRTTTDDKEEAQDLALLLVKNKLSACVQIYPIESVYTWENKIEKDNEFMLEIKTTSDIFEKVRDFILKNHSYEVPEIIVIPILYGSGEYLDWIQQSVI